MPWVRVAMAEVCGFLAGAGIGVKVGRAGAVTAGSLAMSGVKATGAIRSAAWTVKAMGRSIAPVAVSLTNVDRVRKTAAVKTTRVPHLKLALRAVSVRSVLSEVTIG
jgi:hypothetical protein